MMLWGQLTGLSSWLANPWLLVAGSAAVALPVLIHLLNRRRFQVVEWAAMDFLLEADRTNRRRIRLQHVLLLILRCLAVAISGLLLARPFVPTNLTAGLVGVSQFERILILDDSLSMTARAANESAWEAARRNAMDLVRRLAEQRGENSICTLLVTSQPGHPLVSGMPLTKTGVDDLLARIEQLEASDGVAKWQSTLAALDNSLRAQSGVASRVVYLFTDLQRTDWQAREARGEGGSSIDAVAGLRKLSERAQECYVIDVRSERQTDGNLSVTKIQAEGPLVSGVRAALDVTVKNQGSASVGKLAATLTVEDGLPAVEVIEGLKAGESKTVRFQPTFFLQPEDAKGAKALAKSEPRRVSVELQAAAVSDDRLVGDSVAYFPAQITRGIRTLLIDGDPGSEFGRAESFYISRALAPDGPIRSGVVPQVVSDSDLDALSLDEYRVIFLLNTYRLGEKAAENLGRLEQWVARGGSLVLLPGDGVDLPFFNGHMWREGHGLSPLKLETILGDEQQSSWVGIRFSDAARIMPQFAGPENPLLTSIKIFRRWQASVPRGEAAIGINVLASFSDDANSPAIAEKAWGDGRVVAFTIPADADWHNWPSHPSYLLLLQDLVHSLTDDGQARGMLQVGEAIHQPVDVTRYERQAALTGPKLLQATLQAAPLAKSPARAENATVWQVSYPTEHLGFFEISLARRDGGHDRVLFAANADEDEGNLQPADRAALQREFAGTNIRLLAPGELDSLSGSAARAELWWYLAWLLVAVLASEQLLGWLFGRDRS